MGEELGSVAFVPTRIHQTLPYPTTDTDYFQLAYLDETDFTHAGYVSNDVEMTYRINPNKAYVKGAQFGFINRNVTRATGDKTNLLNIVAVDTLYTNEGAQTNGEVTVTTRLNRAALANNDIVALKVQVGTRCTVFSDYVAVSAGNISAIIDNTMSGAPEFYARNKAITKEDDAFVKSFVKLSDKANLGYKYDKEIDLYDYVDLYSTEIKDYIRNHGYDGRITYTFSMPENYLADDAQKTNQQDFASINNGVVTSNIAKYKTAVIGRTPVVRVDAFVDGNFVASAYIKLSIDRNDPVTPDQPDAPAINLELDQANNNQELEYHTLKNMVVDGFTSNIIGEMPWQEVNANIYGATNLTAETFWNYYGGANDTYHVKLTVDGVYQPLIIQSLNRNSETHYNDPCGVDYSIELFDENTTTSNIKVGINNLIKTENTYKDVDGKGAKYTFTITIESDQPKVTGDIVMTQVFYVKEECEAYNYNKLYLVPGTENDIMVKGTVVNGAWSMSSLIAEHFEKIGGKDIFGYYNAVNNVVDLDFAWKLGTTGVEALPATVDNTTYVSLSDAMTTAQATKVMTYTVTLKNTETCKFEYNIIFTNPFVAVSTTGIEMIDGIGVNTGDVKSCVKVNDTDNKLIASYVNGVFTLSDRALDTYKLTDQITSIKYAFKANTDYNTIMSQKDAKSTLAVDPATGVVTWDNQGTALQGAYNLVVNATVTFEDLSVVTCEIPVVLKGK